MFKNLHVGIDVLWKTSINRDVFWSYYPWIFALSAEVIDGTNIIFKSHFVDVIRLHVKYLSISQAITNLNE